MISSDEKDNESIISVILHCLFYLEELKSYFINETFSDFDNTLLKEIKKFLEKYLQLSDRLRFEIDESDMSQFTENSRINTITNTKKEEDSELEDEEEPSKPKPNLNNAKCKVNRETLEISSILEALEQLKSKENFVEVLRNIKTPALFLQLVLDLIHCAKNEIRFDYKKLYEDFYSCAINCPSHSDFFGRVDERIECRCRGIGPDAANNSNNFVFVFNVNEVLHYAQKKTKSNLNCKMLDFFKELNLNYKNSSCECPRRGLACVKNSLKRKIILCNKPNNFIFELQWKDKFPKYSDILKILLMLPIIFKSSDYFDLEDKYNYAYYDLTGFIAYTGEKYVLIQRVFESYSSYWVFYNSNEEPKRFISLKALYGKCLSRYFYPVLLFYKLSYQTSKIINDVNLIIHDEIRISLENFCIEKDKKLVEVNIKKKKKEQLKGWRRLIETDILSKYAENIHKKKEDTINRIFNRKTNIKKAKTSANNNPLMEILKKTIERGQSRKGWKCSFRYCNYINPEDEYTCKKQIHKKKINKNNIEFNAQAYKKCISNPIFYEITSTEKFKKEFIRNNLLMKNIGNLFFKGVEKKLNNKVIKNKILNLNEICVAKEKDEETRKKFVLQKVKNVKNIISYMKDVKKSSNNYENYNSNNNNSTNMSTILLDKSIAIRDLKNTNTINNISMLNKVEQNETNKRQRNYGRKQTKKDINQNASKPLTDLPNKPANESVKEEKEENEEEEHIKTQKLLSDLNPNIKNFDFLTSENQDIETMKINTLLNYTNNLMISNVNQPFKKDETLNSIIDNSLLINTSNTFELYHQKIECLKNSDLKISNAVTKNLNDPESQYLNVNSTLFKYSNEKNQNENIDFFDKNAFVNQQNCIFCFRNQFCTSIGVCKDCFYINEDLTEDNLREYNQKASDKGTYYKNKQELIRYNKFNVDFTGIASENNVFFKFHQAIQKEEKDKKLEEIRNNVNVNVNNFDIKQVKNNVNLDNRENEFYNEKKKHILEDFEKLKNNRIKNNDNAESQKEGEKLHKGFLTNVKNESLNSNGALSNNKIKDVLNFNNIKALHKNENSSSASLTNNKELNLGSGFTSDSLSKINENSLLKNNNPKNNPFESKIVKIKLDGLNNQNISLARDKYSKSSEHLIKNSLNSSTISSNNLNKPIKIIKADTSKENTARSSNKEMKFTIKNEFKIPSANININSKVFVTKNVEINEKAEKENFESKIVIPKIPTIKRTNTRNNKVMNKNTSNSKN